VKKGRGNKHFVVRNERGGVSSFLYLGTFYQPHGLIFGINLKHMEIESGQVII
jgi:hypothetical protein